MKVITKETMKKAERKKYQVRDEKCYKNRECFVPFTGNGIKICRLYEMAQCPSKYLKNWNKRKK